MNAAQPKSYSLIVDGDDHLSELQVEKIIIIRYLQVRHYYSLAIVVKRSIQVVMIVHRKRFCFFIYLAAI